MNSPKLTYPKLDLPKAQEVIAFRAIIKVLRNDPVFGVIVRQWIVWDGSETDLTEPTYSQCPYCSISPFPSESMWITEGQHKGDLALRIMLAVAGTDFDQIGNFWGAMRAAIFPQNNVKQRSLVQTQLTAASILRPTIRTAAYGQRTEEQGVKFMVADGLITFGLLIGT